MSTRRSEYLRGYQDALDGRTAAPPVVDGTPRPGAPILLLVGGGYFQKGTRAVLKSMDGEHWWADFRGQGNPFGSFDDSIDGVWCVGTGIGFEVIE